MMNTSDPIIFALDTAQEDCAVAVLQGSRVLSEFVEHVGNKHAECVLALADKALAEAHVEKHAISLVAFGAGPGSFTGLRVACGAAQGIAWAQELPIAPVSNLEALAQLVRETKSLQPGTCIGVMNDARMNECYSAVYEVPADGSRLVVVTGPELVKPAEAKQYLEMHRVGFYAGTACTAYADVFGVPKGTELWDGLSTGLAASIGRLAFEDLKAGRTVSPALAAPLYVRNRVALTIEERARGERL